MLVSIRRHTKAFNPGARMLIIDDKPNPDRGKLMAKFKVENNMRTLKITMENNDNPSGRIIKLCASVKKGEWTVNQQKERLIPLKMFAKTHKRIFQRKKVISKMKQAFSLTAKVKDKGSNEVSSYEVMEALQKAFISEEGSLVASVIEEQQTWEKLSKMY
ncbi:hypothetical protein JHK87_004414 [Glycine soja]|nr:hypothetical protein JHK87_004414 [Glycine soja]